MSVIFLPAILGPETVSPIIWAPGFFGSFCWTTPHAHKTPRFRGRGGGSCVFWMGGMEVPNLFLWAQRLFWNNYFRGPSYGLRSALSTLKLHHVRSSTTCGHPRTFLPLSCRNIWHVVHMPSLCPSKLQQTFSDIVCNYHCHRYHYLLNRKAPDVGAGTCGIWGHREQAQSMKQCAWRKHGLCDMCLAEACPPKLWNTVECSIWDFEPNSHKNDGMAKLLWGQI